MKNILWLVTLCLFSFSLLSAQNVDKSAATMDIIMGFTDEFENPESNKKYLNPDLKVVWPGGNVWPGNKEGSFEKFVTFYATARDKNKHEFPGEIVVKELDNETYAFFTWKNTIRKHDDHPEAVGKSATGPIAYRMVWKGNQIEEWHIFCDFKSRDKKLGILK